MKSLTNRSVIAVLLLLFLVPFWGCSGEDGLDGVDGAPLSVKSEEATEEECPQGGRVVSFGYDRSGDGELDEIVSVEKICNGDLGAPGEEGEPVLVETSAAEPGACAEGGTTVTFGYDRSGDGDIDEVVAQESICNGADAPESERLRLESGEAMDCVFGGIRYVFGYDTNGDGAIDDQVYGVSECLSSAEVIEGTSVLYFADLTLETDAVLAGLEDLEEEGVISLVVGESEFEGASDFAELAAGADFDVVIYFNQNEFVIPEDDRSVLQGRLSEGRATIFANWSTSEPNLLDLFEAERTGSTNSAMADLIDERLGSGFGSPLELSSSGWVAGFSYGLAPTGTAVSVCVFEQGDSCGVLGNDGKSLLFGFLNDSFRYWEGKELVANAIYLVLTD